MEWWGRRGQAARRLEEVEALTAETRRLLELLDANQATLVRLPLSESATMRTCPLRPLSTLREAALDAVAWPAAAGRTDLKRRC